MTAVEVIVSDKAGFCFGVERAVETAVREAEKKDMPVYTFGPIVHNEIVIRDLQELSVRVISEEDLPDLPKGRIIIRAHGVTEAMEKRLRDTGSEVTDATCPFVKKIHRIVREHSENGEHILVMGDPRHPEVQGIVGWAKGPVTVLSSEAEAECFRPEPETAYCIVSQTTFNLKKFEKMIEILGNRLYNANIANTICSATRERQEEAGKIAASVDLMLVIGSETSSNSAKLYEICKKHCSHTYFIQSLADVREDWFQDVKCVGITAGASTPKKILKEVQKHVRKF